MNALKFTTETNSIRLCRKIGDIFEPPEDGWGERLYIVHAPGPPLYQQGVPTSGKLSVHNDYLRVQEYLVDRKFRYHLRLLNLHTSAYPSR